MSSDQNNPFLVPDGEENTANPFVPPEDQSAHNPFAVESQLDPTVDIETGKKIYGGLRRTGWLVWGILLQLLPAGLVIFGFSYGALFANVLTIAGQSVSLISILVYLLFQVPFLIITGLRFKNIGVSPLVSPFLTLTILIPYFNFITGLICLICPEGYRDHRKLDRAAYFIVGMGCLFVIGTLLLVWILVNSF